MRKVLTVASTLAPMLFLVAAPACTGPVDPSSARNLSGIGVNRGAIVGGMNDTGDPSVVLVFAQKPGSQEAGLCTGEVVSPHVVLTAAHCVDPASVGTGMQFSIFTGDDMNNSTQANDNNLWVDAVSTDWDMAFNLNDLEGGHDVGVVVTSKAFMQTPLPVNQMPIDNTMMNNPLRLVGYGITSTSTQQDTSGTKRQVTTTMDSYTSKFINYGDSQHNTCEGDSGGPAFMNINGQDVIVGITSFGDQTCTSSGSDTRVDQYWTSFILPHITAAEGMAPPTPTQTPDMGQSPSNPSNPSNPDMGPGSVTPGQIAGTGEQVGASCTNGNQCASGVCTTGGSGYCTEACDPANANACPSGMHCGSIGSASYCILAEGGCSASARSLASNGAATTPFLLLVLFGLTRVVFRRRVALQGSR